MVHRKSLTAKARDAVQDACALVSAVLADLAVRAGIVTIDEVGRAAYWLSAGVRTRAARKKR